MRPRLALTFASVVLCALASAQTKNAESRQLLQDAEAKCDQIGDPNTRADDLADIASAWQLLDKKKSLALLNKAADGLDPDSTAWKDILSIWANQDQSGAFQEALSIANSDAGAKRTGELLATIASTDPTKADDDLTQVPSSTRQFIAETATKNLAIDNEDFATPFIQGAANVKLDALYDILAFNCEDAKLSLKSAQLAGDDKSGAMAEAIRKTAQTDPVLAHNLVAQVTDSMDRSMAIAYCADAFYASDPDNGKQCAAESIDLFDQSPPEWENRSKAFLKLEPYLSGIDSPEVRGFLQRFTDLAQTNINNITDIHEQANWLANLGGIWSRLDLIKARQFVAQAQQLDPDAGAMVEAGLPNISPLYERFLVELSMSDPDSAAQLITNAGFGTFHETARSVLTDLEPNNADAARAVAKTLGGDFPNFAEAEMDIKQMSPDAAADGLLRIESDSFPNYEFEDQSTAFVDLLLQSDPYRAVRVIINLEVAQHRIPLLSRAIVAVAKTNIQLAESSYEKASHDMTYNMNSDDAAYCGAELAKAAIAIGR